MKFRITTPQSDFLSAISANAPAFVRIDCRRVLDEPSGKHSHRISLGFPSSIEEYVEQVVDWIWPHLRDSPSSSVEIDGILIKNSEVDLAYALATASTCLFKDRSVCQDYRLSVIEELGILIMSAGFVDHGTEVAEIGRCGLSTALRLRADLLNSGKDQALRRVDTINQGFISLTEDYCLPVGMHEAMFRNYQLLRMHVRAGLYAC